MLTVSYQELCQSLITNSPPSRASTKYPKRSFIPRYTRRLQLSARSPSSSINHPTSEHKLRKRLVRLLDSPSSTDVRDQLAREDVRWAFDRLGIDVSALGCCESWWCEGYGSVWMGCLVLQSFGFLAFLGAVLYQCVLTVRAIVLFIFDPLTFPLL